jgi:hypothetical protein
MHFREPPALFGAELLHHIGGLNFRLTHSGMADLGWHQQYSVSHWLIDVA